MLIKNVPKNKIIWVIFMRMILDGLAGFQFILKGKFKHFFAILQAHYSFYSVAGKFYKKRNIIQKTNYFKIKSIVYRYFIKSGKEFDKLF
jgi:hypothetical protein